MQGGPKSALTVSQGSRKDLNSLSGTAKQIQYVQVNNKDDYIGELSDEEKEAEFNRQHDQYIKMKVNRKKELLKVKMEQFGPSSSDEQSSSSEEEITQKVTISRVELKNSRSKLKSKSSLQNEQTTFPIKLQLKKVVTNTSVTLKQQEFQINKQILPYSKINKISLSSPDNSPNTLKLRIGLFNIDDIVMSWNREQSEKSQLMDIFVRLVLVKLQQKQINLKQYENRSNPQQYLELKQGASIYDLIFKKSQIIGTWQQRFIIIKPEGLYSYRVLKSKPTMFIETKQVKQIQTQFQLYKDTLVLKLIYNTTKTDFGLPIDNKLCWVRAFADLICKQ